MMPSVVYCAFLLHPKIAAPSEMTFVCLKHPSRCERLVLCTGAECSPPSLPMLEGTRGEEKASKCPSQK